MDLGECSSTGEGAWYDDIRYALVQKLLKGQLEEARLVVDVGCGQGGILRGIRRDHATVELAGTDPFLTDELIGDLACEDIAATRDFPAQHEAKADVVLLMDVLEHVDQPATLLAQAVGLLRPGGVAVVTVPAYRWLWSDHDVALGHRDRYTLRRVRRLILEAHLQNVTVRHSGYSLPLLMLAAAPVRLVGRLVRFLRPAREARSQLESVGGGLQALLGAVGRVEARAFGARSPFGLTCVAVLTAGAPA